MIISTNSFDPATFGISLFRNSGEPVSAASVDALVTDLRRFTGDLQGVGASTSAGQAGTMRPNLQFEMIIRPEEIGELRQIVERFAQSEKLVLHDFVALSREPVKPGTLFLWLERDDSAMRVIVHNYSDDIPRIFVLFHDLRSDPRFNEAVAKLWLMIGERWPGQLVPMEPVRLRPTLRLELRISPDEGEEVRKVFERFAAAGEFEMTEPAWVIAPPPGEWRPIVLTLTRGRTMRIKVEESLVRRGRFVISISDLNGDPRFEETSAALKEMLLEKWPGRLFPSAD